MIDTSELEPAAERRLKLNAAAVRALSEAEARRQSASQTPSEANTAEHGGPQGPEPVRYGDWEINGIAKDF